MAGRSGASAPPVIGGDGLAPAASRAPLTALLAATALSLVGSGLTIVALPWFVLATTGSPARAGVVASAVALPAFLAGLLGGPLIDRLGARRVAVAADVVGALGIGLIPLLYHTVGLPFAALLVLVFLGETLAIPGLTARRAVLPDLAARAGVRLERANAAAEALTHLALLLGPPLAGLLIVGLGPSRVLWIDAATFALSAAVMAAALPRTALPVVVAATGGYLAELGAGVRFLRRDRLLLTLALTLTASNLLTGPLFAVLLPVYADRVYGSASALGLIIAAVGAGSLVGAIAFGAIGHRLPRRAIWLTGFGGSPAAFWVLAVEPSLPAMVAVQFVVGLVGGGLNPLLVTVRHERIPAELRGRVFGAFSAAALAAQPLGMLAAGVAVEAIGFQPTVLVLAMLAQAVGIASFAAPALRDLDRLRPTAGAIHGRPRT